MMEVSKVTEVTKVTQAIKAYQKLVVWQEAHRCVLEIYRVTDRFPNDEKFGLTSQIRRAALSVPTNIVEGHAKHSRKDFRRFLNIASGSLAECEYLLEVARDLKYLSLTEYEELEKIRRSVGFLLYKFCQSLKP